MLGRVWCPSWNQEAEARVLSEGLVWTVESSPSTRRDMGREPQGRLEEAVRGRGLAQHAQGEVGDPGLASSRTDTRASQSILLTGV